ncbi:MAG: hypothetical protein ACKO8C_02740 [Candidatus Nanopelagicaceae bacterium]
MKKLLPLLCSLALLTGCSSSESKVPIPSKTTSGKVPTSCELDSVNAAFAEIIPPSKYIPTEWTPAEGTDLYAALNNGGIACSYGDADAEVGGTVIWSLADDAFWQELVGKWQSEGLEKIDIPGIDEVEAYKLPDGSTSADGMPAWRVNLLIDGVWIQLGAAFIQSFDEATPIIEAAINVIK